MTYRQATLALDGAARPNLPHHAEPLPVAAMPLHGGGWAAPLRHAFTPSGRRLPDDLWDEYRCECAMRDRLHLPAVSLAEFRDMRDWADQMEEQEDDDDDRITESDTDAPPYGRLHLWR